MSDILEIFYYILGFFILLVLFQISVILPIIIISVWMFVYCFAPIITTIVSFISNKIIKQKET